MQFKADCASAKRVEPDDNLIRVVYATRPDGKVDEECRELVHVTTQAASSDVEPILECG